MRQVLIDYIEEQLLSGRSGIKVAAEDDLMGSGLIDSMGMMRFVRFIEDHFEITIPPEDLVIENFMTVEDIDNYLKGRKSA
ncbi:acyl carrier protein [Fulvivirgaceae bacterium BMA12]|uniref:Acyl carrier protein n=1 Tax=Agaribacillus aureus TaxID=3051825 RepID=A0ABT8L938_9BACT|nr:acyl carrier protein [Fulvivirgaceae bacterium BMA12]